MHAWLNAHAEERGESLSSHVAGLLAAARRHREEPESTLAAQLATALDRLHRAIQESRADHRFLEEMLAMYVRVYMNHAPSHPEHKAQEISRAGGERFEKFLKYLTQHYGRKSLLAELREAKANQPEVTP